MFRAVSTLVGALFLPVLWAAPVVAQSASVTLSPVATLGCDFCDGPEQFGVVIALGVGGGRVVVGDRDAPHLRVFGLDGVFREAFGEEGEGPGELRFPMAIGSGPTGISVLDMKLQRVLMLDDQGVEQGRGLTSSFPLAAAFAPASEALLLSVANWIETTAGIKRWDPATRDIENVLESVEELILAEPGQPTMYFSLALAADGRFAIGEGRDVYRLQVFSSDGQRTVEVQRTPGRTPKSDRELADEQEATSRTRARMATSVEGAGTAPEVDSLRRHFSLDAVRFDGSGRLWVRTDRATSGTVFDIFDPVGVYLGEVAVPGRITAFALGDGHLVAAELDDLDLATVGVYRHDWN